MGGERPRGHGPGRRSSVTCGGGARTCARGSAAEGIPRDDGPARQRRGGDEHRRRVAVLLPFYSIEAGVGLSKRVDLIGRFESVTGVLHYPSLGVRVSPVELGAWRLGLAFAVNYSFFGIKTDQLNLTSTFYLSASAGVSRPVTKFTDLTADVTG